jgi:hypothetical protein
MKMSVLLIHAAVKEDAKMKLITTFVYVKMGLPDSSVKAILMNVLVYPVHIMERALME